MYQQYHLTKCGTFQMWATTYLTLERGITPLCLLNIDGNTDSRAVYRVHCLPSVSENRIPLIFHYSGVEQT